MAHVRKYRMGKMLTFSEFCQEIEAARYIMHNNKPTHPGWAMSWRISMALAMCRGGQIRAAEITPEWEAAHPQLDTEFEEVEA